MRFGLFGGAQATPGDVVTGAVLGYHDYGDYVQLAERLGYTHVFLVEHHFTGFAQLSATLNYISYLAGRTSTIRLGTAVTVIPWHNPVLLAEQIATIDQLSKGRFDLGIGKGYRYTEFHGFNIEPSQLDSIFEEALVVIERAFAETGRWSYRSDRWTFNDIIVEPPVVQRPHPPFWQGAASPDSVRRAARNGYKLLLDQHSPPQLITDKIKIYQDELAKVGRPFDPYSVGVSRGLIAANDAAERELKHHYRSRFISETQTLTKDPRLQDKAFNPSPLMAGTPREMSETSAIIGNTQEMIDRIGKLYDGGVRLVLLHDLTGSRPHLDAALRQFATEVMPHFADDAAAAARRPVAAE